MGAYIIQKDRLISFHGEKCTYLEQYLNHYSTRVKLNSRHQRGSIILELKNVRAVGLFYGDKEIVGADKSFNVKLIVTLNKFGVSTITYWVNVNSRDVVETSFMLRQPDKIRSKFEIDFIGFSGNLSFRDLTLLIAMLVLLRVYPHQYPKLNVVNILSQNLETVETLFHRMCLLIPSHYAVLTEPDSYPVFYLEPDLTTERVTRVIESVGREIRAVFTGDLNWKHKKMQVVRNHLAASSVATRESAPWFVDSDGTLLLLSSTFESDRHWGRVLPIFELEILMTLKHYLTKILFLLNTVPTDSSSMYELAQLKETTHLNLEEFYNVDISSKDTTRKRMEACKQILGITRLLNVVEARFEIVSSRITARYQRTNARTQALLTLIFGTFGAGALSYSLSSLYFEKSFQMIIQPTSATPMIVLDSFEMILISTLALMVIIFIVMSYVLRRTL